MKSRRGKFRIEPILAALLLLFLWGCQGEETSSEEEVPVTQNLPFYNSADFTPHWITPKSDSLDDFHRIPPFSLTNQNGETITEKTFAGKIYVVDFFFTSCPGICPKMTKNMTLLQDAFRDDDEVLLMSHSVTPESDSVSILRGYADMNDVQDGKWHLVTGERSEIYDLGRNQYFVEENMGLEKSPSDFLHTENFVLIDQNRHIRGIFNGLDKADIQHLIEDIKTLKNEG